MQQETPTQLVRKLELYIGQLPSVRQRNAFAGEQRKVLIAVMQHVALAREQIAFSLADEDADARNDGLHLAVEQLRNTIGSILAASMHNLIDAVEVSQLTAIAELCIDRIQYDYKQEA